jgi:putative YphP/YqiW family bacilliredoxin
MPQISLKSLMNDNTPTYAAALVQPYRDELTAVGFKELLTVAEVDMALDKQDDKIILAVLNSVCGCSARSARPGTVLSLLNRLVPDEFVTLFAGMEKEAVTHFREKYLPGLTPSSPNIALFKNGELVHMLHRYQIEGKNAMGIDQELTAAYDKVCTKINSREEIDRLKNYIGNRYPTSIESSNT